MSADNGIYILETQGPEFRVKEMAAVDNIYWDDSQQKMVRDPDVMIANAREMWDGCEVYTDKTSALVEADRIFFEIMASNFPVLEYGISTIVVDRKF